MSGRPDTAPWYVRPTAEWLIGLSGAALLAIAATRTPEALPAAALPIGALLLYRWPLVPMWLLTFEMVLGGWGHLIDFRGLPIRHALLGLLLAAWLGRRFATGDRRVLGGAHVAADATFLAFVLIAVLVSVIARNPEALSDGLTPFFLLMVLPFFDIADGRRGVLTLIRTFLAAVGLLAVVQIALSAGIAVGVLDGNYLAALFDQRLGGVVQLSGPFWRVFIVGSIYYQVGILLLTASLTMRRPLFGWTSDATVLALLITSLLLTFTRGYWASAIIGLGVLGVLASSAARVRLLIVAMTAVLILFAVIPLTDSAFADVLWQRVLQTFSPDRDISVALRLDLYPRLMARIAERPWLGYGFGVLVENQLYYENSYFYYAIKIGVVGVLVTLLPWALLLWTGLRLAQRRSDPECRALAAGMTAAVVSMLAVTSINPFINSAVGLYFQALATAVLVGLEASGPSST